MLTVCALSPVKSTRSIKLRLTRPRDRFSIMFIKVFIYSGVRRVLRAALQDASDTVRNDAVMMPTVMMAVMNLWLGEP